MIKFFDEYIVIGFFGVFLFKVKELRFRKVDDHCVEKCWRLVKIVEISSVRGKKIYTFFFLSIILNVITSIIINRLQSQDERMRRNVNNINSVIEINANDDQRNRRNYSGRLNENRNDSKTVGKDGDNGKKNNKG